MELREKIEKDFIEALKRKDDLAVSTLRMLKAAMHNKEIEKRGEQLKDAEVIKIISKQVYEHEDSIEQFTKGKRLDLVEKESKELEILKEYLPSQLSEQEVTNVVKKLIAETGVKTQADFGKVMKLAMAELKDKADGKLVNQVVSSLLNLK